MSSNTEQAAKIKLLKEKLSASIKKTGYSELYGFDFSDQESFTSEHEAILSKFLVANQGDVDLAAAQLEKTLEWRKTFKPLSAATDETHDEQFERLGFITKAPRGKIITWNLYGAVKDRKALFTNLDKFIRWRVGLMERGIALMDFNDEDNAYMDQVHDYMDVSFLRLDGETRKASSTVIKLFQDYYPEFLSAKFFVNVPGIMTWMFTFAKAFMSKETAEKFHVVGNGKDLMPQLGEWVPKQYGGNGPSLSVLSEATFKDNKSRVPTTKPPAETIVTSTAATAPASA